MFFKASNAHSSLMEKSEFKQTKLNPTEQQKFHEEFDTALMQYHGIN